jgi:uncharacterized protein (TIGR02996 family)
MTEEVFIQAILEAPDDPTHRLVYADWLEERNDDARAGFLRAQAALFALPADDAGREEAAEGLRERRAGLDPTWLARLDHAPVENCDARLTFDFECPKRWETLTPTGDPLVRHCDACGKGVHYCGSIREARDHAWQGHCVAVDSLLTRSPGDLELPMVTMGVLRLEPPSEEEARRIADELRQRLIDLPPSPRPRRRRR